MFIKKISNIVVAAGAALLLSSFAGVAVAQVVADASFRTFYPQTELSRSSRSFTANSSILPITLDRKISGLSVSGNITFTGAKGFARVVLESGDGNEYLVLETNRHTSCERMTDLTNLKYLFLRS